MKISKFLPFENYSLVTKLTVENVCTRIAENVQPKKAFSYFSRMAGTKLYEGEINGHSFSISGSLIIETHFYLLLKAVFIRMLQRQQ